jgi:outer membrane protein
MTRFVLAAFALLALATPAAAQKIGYCNFQLLVSRHPDANVAQQQLSTHEKQLQERLRVKQEYAQAKLQEYQELAQAKRMTPEEENTKRRELEKLDEELQAASADARTSMQRKQEELLQPIVDKVKGAVEAQAKDEGYTYILNDGPKGTTVLMGPAADDVTERVAKRLNITLADPAPAPKPSTGGAPAPKPAGAPK